MKTNLFHSQQKSSPRAFTLIELLVVLAIMIVLIALLVPPTANILNGVSINSAGQTIQGKLALWRQLAISRNRTVEVRFYAVPDQLSPQQTHFRMFQPWIYDSNGANPAPLEKITTLPQGVILEAVTPSNGSASSFSSTAIDSAPDQGTDTIPSVGSGSYTYRAFRYRGSGNTDLSLNGTGSDTWFLTARLATDFPHGQSTLPKNYYTIQIDPLTGQTKAFRP